MKSTLIRKEGKAAETHQTSSSTDSGHGTFTAESTNNKDVHVSINKNDKGQFRTEFPMGIEVVRGGVPGLMSVLVPAKTLLDKPVSEQKIYGTLYDNQTECFIQVFSV